MHGRGRVVWFCPLCGTVTGPPRQAPCILPQPADPGGRQGAVSVTPAPGWSAPSLPLLVLSLHCPLPPPPLLSCVDQSVRGDLLFLVLSCFLPCLSGWGPFPVPPSHPWAPLTVQTWWRWGLHTQLGGHPAVPLLLAGGSALHAGLSPGSSPICGPEAPSFRGSGRETQPLGEGRARRAPCRPPSLRLVCGGASLLLYLNRCPKGANGVGAQVGGR